jgi:hypothetical protein
MNNYEQLNDRKQLGRPFQPALPLIRLLALEQFIYQHLAVQQPIQQRRRTSAKNAGRDEQSTGFPGTTRTPANASEQFRLSPPFGTHGVSSRM